jgi:RNA polymerase sigma-70 factor (ECF subfamily)
MSNASETLPMPPCVGPTTAEETDRDRAARVRRMFDAHFDFIGRILRNLGVPSCDVDDLVQQVFTVTAAKLGRIPPAAERAFLVQTAIRTAAGARRARARTREIVTDEIPDLADGAPSPEELSDARRARALLDAVLAAMDIELRTAFVLYEIEELTVPDIAQLLEIPQGTVSSRLRRAREDFGKRLRRTQPHQQGDKR